MSMIDPRPGDFAVVNTGTPRITSLIRLGERLAGGHSTPWDHAVICSDVRTDGTVMIVEAEPAGAAERPWHYKGRPHLWSTDRVRTNSQAATEARKLIGRGYSWLDYLAIAAHSWHLPAPGLQGFISDSGRLICSQLVDLAECHAGVHLFDDGRWPGYVMPSDLGALIMGR